MCVCVYIYILWLLYIIFSTVVVMLCLKKKMCGVDFLLFMTSSVKSASPTKTSCMSYFILLTINPLYQYETHSHCFTFQSQ